MADHSLKPDRAFRANLLAWYDVHRRELPWRAPPGKPADPYHVWLSEIMLQQTTVKAVIPYFQSFLRKWPNLSDLAASQRDEVLSAWAGLGYYSRARNLHACAQMVVQEHDGIFPDCERQLLKLPGIGPYTAAALAAIAFSRPANVVDGNVERVIARYCLIDTPLPAAKREIRERAARLAPVCATDRPGDHAQALMDLGATICTPKSPSCQHCPLKANCRAHHQGEASALPVRQKRPAKPLRRGAAFLIERDNALLLRQRPDQGLLGGMMEVPGTAWAAKFPNKQERLQAAPIKVEFHKLAGLVHHTFTHFDLELRVFRAQIAAGTATTALDRDARYKWVARCDLDTEALPGVMRKVISHGR